MVLLRSSVVMAGLLNMGKAQARWNLGASNTVLVYGAGGMTWSKKAVIIKNAPYTIDKPTTGQAMLRQQFGETAHEAKGVRGLINGLPPAAGIIQERFHPTISSKYPSREAYPSSQRHTIHTVKDLERMIEKGETTGPKLMQTAKVLREFG